MQQKYVILNCEIEIWTKFLEKIASSNRRNTGYWTSLGFSSS